MNENDQVSLLLKVEEASLPDYALKRLEGEDMSAEEQKSCERFCIGVAAELVRQGKLQPDEPAKADVGFVPTSQAMLALFRQYPEASLPEYALAFLIGEGEDLSPQEMAACQAYALRLAARTPNPSQNAPAP